MNTDINITEALVGVRPTRSGRALRAGILGLALGVGSIAGIAGPAGAAPNGTTIANVGVSSGITMTGLTPSFTLTGAPGQIIDGLSAVSFNVETNSPSGYSVTVRSEAAAMVPAPLNGDSIPIAALTVRESGVGGYTPMSATSPLTVHSQAGRSVDGGDLLHNDFQIRIPVVIATTYSVTLEYIAANN